MLPVQHDLDFGEAPLPLLNFLRLKEPPPKVKKALKDITKVAKFRVGDPLVIQTPKSGESVRGLRSASVTKVELADPNYHPKPRTDLPEPLYLVELDSTATTHARTSPKWVRETDVHPRPLGVQDDAFQSSRTKWNRVWDYDQDFIDLAEKEMHENVKRTLALASRKLLSNLSASDLYTLPVSRLGGGGGSSSTISPKLREAIGFRKEAMNSRSRPWRLGVDWRFVVGTSLPHGDNDRVSLHYEATKHGDIDMVRGSELPPRQARVALRWLVHAAALSAREAGSAPRYIGLTYDALLISLPRLATRLRALGPAIERGVEATSGRPSSAYSDGARTAGFPSMTRRLVYGGSLRWAAWADGASGGATWRCVRAAAPAELLSARLVGDSAPSHEELGAQARRRAERRPSCGDVSRGRAFLAAAPELQLLSTQLLQRASAALLRRLHVHRLEVAPPSELWDRSLVHHQSAAGRTPAPPALLAATAIARAVANVSAAHRGAVTYLQLRSAVNVPPFSWEMDPPKYPGVTSLLARAVTDGVMAEAVAERFTRQRAAAVAGAGRLRCGRERCAAWGMSEAAPPHGQALCCEERPQPAAHAAAGAR